MMRALSIRQPWAAAIVHLDKRIENRSWNTKFRGKFLIHAAQTIDYNAPQWVWEALRGVDMPTGGIIGEAELIDVVTKSDSKWFGGSYGFVLENVQPMKYVPYPGRLNFFKVEFLK